MVIMPRKGKFVIRESSSEEEGAEFERDLGADVSEKLEAPFPVFEAEADYYKSISKRKIKTPLFIDVEKWKTLEENGDEFASRVMWIIRRLGLEKWAGVKKNAYPDLMHEFFISCSHTFDGTLECRFGGQWFSFSASEIEEIFGFHAQGGFKLGGPPDKHGIFPGHDEDYDENEFWESINCKGLGPTSRNTIGALHDNSVYYAYKYLTLGLWGKGEASKIPSDEMYFLWRLLKDGWEVDPVRLCEEDPINLYPYMLANIKKISAVKKTLNAPLSLGSFITTLALKRDWKPRDKMKKIVARVLPFGNRLLRTPLRPEGVPVPITVLRDRNANEDELYDAWLKNSRKDDDDFNEEPERPARPEPEMDPDAVDEARPDVGPSAQPEIDSRITFHAPRARARKDRSRPGKQVPASPPPTARVPSGGPTMEDFEAMLREMRANHRAMIVRQERIEDKVDNYIEEDRAWKKEMREDIKFLLFRDGFEDDLHENEAIGDHAERVARDQEGEP